MTTDTVKYDHLTTFHVVATFGNFDGKFIGGNAWELNNGYTVFVYPGQLISVTAIK